MCWTSCHFLLVDGDFHVLGETEIAWGLYPKGSRVLTRHVHYSDSSVSQLGLQANPTATD